LSQQPRPNHLFPFAPIENDAQNPVAAAAAAADDYISSVPMQIPHLAAAALESSISSILGSSSHPLVSSATHQW